MKANDLLKQVSIAASVVDSNCLVPIAKNLWFQDGTICATDLNLNIIVNTEFTFSETAVAVDTQKIVALLKSLKGQEVDITFGSPTTTVTSSTGEYKISAYDGAEFPKIDIQKGDFTAKTYMFERAIDLTKGSVSNDDLRPSMTGIYFDSELNYAVATNGHKLSRYQAKFEDSFILPAYAFPLIKLLDSEEVSYGSTNTKVSFYTDDVAFEVAKIDGKYPPYSKVIPENNDKTLTVEASELQDVVKRIALFSNAETGAIVFDMGGKVVISGQDVNFGNSAEENLDAKFTSPSDLKIGFSAKYLGSVLNGLEGTLTITFSELNKPALITSNSNPRLLQLVMPVVI